MQNHNMTMPIQISGFKLCLCFIKTYFEQLHILFPRLKLSNSLLYNNLMSTKKVIRLKTPLKERQQCKPSDSCIGTCIDFNQESTILMELQLTLINQINKIYKQISKLKHRHQQDEQIIGSLYKENKNLKNLMETLEKDSHIFKQLYELEKDNHQRLRKFYELREKQWICIINQHQKILQEYDRQNKAQDQNERESQLQVFSSMLHSLVELVSKPSITPITHRNPLITESIPQRKLKIKSNQRENSLSQNKVKLKLNFYRQPKSGNRIKYQQPHSAAKLCSSQANIQLTSKTQALKNAKADDIFDSIIRKTYYKYKERYISVGQIENMEDMIKLKNAKTSTKQRLVKTIRKLDFQIENDLQLKILCQYVERAVEDRNRIFRGDYVFELLVDKLKQCEKLAMSSNSELSRLDKEKSLNPESVAESNIYNDSQDQWIMGSNRSNHTQRSIKNMDLLLDSDIKDKRMKDEHKGNTIDLLERIKCTSLKRSASQLYQVGNLAVESRYLPIKVKAFDQML